MKGQWFLISAVVATSAFLAISFLFKGYFVSDATDTAKMNEDYYFHNIRQQFNNVIAQSDCTRMDRNAREFRVFAEREIGNLGYLLFLNFSISDCSTKSYTLGLLIASERMIVCQNVNADDILPNVIDITCQ